MSFAIKVDTRLKALEARCKANEDKLEELFKRIEALEAKRGPGRPPNHPVLIQKEYGETNPSKAKNGERKPASGN